MEESPSGIVSLVLRDHAKAAALLKGIEEQPLAQLADYFCNLRQELVRHEVAEELVVYPALRKHVRGGDQVAAACIEEQSRAEATMAALEDAPTDTETFRAALIALRAEVLAHAEHEERDVLPELASVISHDELRQLGGRYERALAMAPTHPHPHAPDTPPGNRVLGPITALLDRVRDAMRAA